MRTATCGRSSNGRQAERLQQAPPPRLVARDAALRERRVLVRAPRRRRLRRGEGAELLAQRAELSELGAQRGQLVQVRVRALVGDWRCVCCAGASCAMSL